MSVQQALETTRQRNDLARAALEHRSRRRCDGRPPRVRILFGLAIGRAEPQRVRRPRKPLLHEYCTQIDRDPGEITRSLLAWPFMPETPFDSNDAFHDLVGRYREVGIDEFIFRWLREEALEYGYNRSMVERCVGRKTLERLATEVIPKLRA